jgi:hypothetical protein
VSEDVRTEKRKWRGSRVGTALAYALGAGILALLIRRMPLHDLTRAFEQVGWSVLLVLAIMPMTFLSSSLSLRSVLASFDSERALERAGWRVFRLCYLQFVGEGFNTLLPLAGLGGEPYKVAQLAKTLPLGHVSQAAVYDRLIHAISGLASAAISIGLTPFFLPMTHAVRWVFAAMAAACLIGGTLMSWLCMSRAPGRMTRSVLARFAQKTQGGETPLRPGRFFASLGWKMGFRLHGLLEVYVIFRVLGIHPSLGQAISVMALILASTSFFFIIPQGLGVSELGITGAFAMAGLPAHLGLAFGLIRRARAVIWALIALFVHYVTKASLGIRRRRTSIHTSSATALASER